MKWEFSNDAPIYAQLILQIKGWNRLRGIPSRGTAAVGAGRPWRPGSTPNTMQRALTELERDGLVYSQRTAGRFVTEDRNMINAAKRGLAEHHIQVFLAAMRQLGYQQGGNDCPAAAGNR